MGQEKLGQRCSDRMMRTVRGVNTTESEMYWAVTLGADHKR